MIEVFKPTTDPWFTPTYRIFGEPTYLVSVVFSPTICSLGFYSEGMRVGDAYCDKGMERRFETVAQTEECFLKVMTAPSLTKAYLDDLGFVEV